MNRNPLFRVSNRDRSFSNAVKIYYITYLHDSLFCWLMVKFSELVSECTPQPCCTLETADVPNDAWMYPNLADPRNTVSRPRGSDTYPHRTSLIVNLSKCFPLSIIHSTGCAEIAYGGLHLIRCLNGFFRHAMFPKTPILAVSCGRCV